MLKHAGVFGDLGKDINCGEFTNTDVYKLDLFQKKPKRPDVCVKADPDNTLCQLSGSYTLHLDIGPGKYDHYANVPLKAHMAEKCPSLNPDYKVPADC